MMGMYFDFVTQMQDILFEGWDTNSTKDIIIASLVVFVFTFLYEGFKFLKAYIIIRRLQSPLTYGDHSQPTMLPEQTPRSPSASSYHDGAGNFPASTAELLSPLKIPVSIEYIRKWRITLFMIESLIHIVNFFYGYLLMLLVMTYNVWFLLAVLVGSGAGFLVFDPLRQTYSDKYLNSDLRSGGCHGNVSPQQPVQTTINNQDTALMKVPQRNYQTLTAYK